MTDEDAEREAYDASGLFCDESGAFGVGFRAGLAHARAQRAERIAALERVAEAARVLHLQGPYCANFYTHARTGHPWRDLRDALIGLDRAQADAAEGKDSVHGSGSPAPTAPVLELKPDQQPGPTYPCDRCGKLRTKEQGGTVFTVCDECWSATMRKDSGGSGTDSKRESSEGQPGDGGTLEPAKEPARFLTRADLARIATQVADDLSDRAAEPWYTLASLAEAESDPKGDSDE